MYIFSQLMLLRPPKFYLTHFIDLSITHNFVQQRRKTVFMSRYFEA